ncbi:putative trans-sialidase, Group II [Trypanosoma cruzi]|uniref:Putative trans-sialidase, Group II n=1 Tax=Trypanosoma cruzi TaxID=5693 RepID=A0A2V2XIG2_TRYCR|nr:putative trans-sialidase, Group II [Trypanosoma cruzi]
MLSRVAAVKAPRTHNRRCVTGSSGRRREGRESEPQRPNMSRRVFASAVPLLLLVVWMCCATCGATSANEEDGKNDLINIQNLQRVDLFVPQKTLVQPKDGIVPGTTRDLFVSPSLVSAGGVIAAFAEGHINAEYQDGQRIKLFSSDVVAEYIDSVWDWPTLVEKVNEGTWSAHTVLDKAEGKDRMGVLFHPTTITKGNKVFLLVGSSDVLYENEEWGRVDLELTLVVGDVTPSTRGEPGGRIKWGDPRPLFDSKYSLKHKSKLNTFFPSGGSGVLMEDGTLVFSLMAMKENPNEAFYTIVYSKNGGENWSLSEGMSPPKCYNPRVTEWEGTLLMIVDCEDGQRVYESRDMGTTWTEAIGKLLGVWAKPRSVFWEVSLHVDALITATIGGRKVMLYTQRGYALGKKRATAFYLWVTDNNRSFSVGPVAVEEAAVRWELASTLLYSDGKLHLLQRRGNGGGSVISLSRMTEELKEIGSVLSTWSQKDVFFSSFSIPTAGLVAVLSDAAGDGRWIDEYLCLNATVRNAKKVKDGVQLTEPDSRVMWPVNTRGGNVRHISLSHNFTLVASVTIEEAPSENTPLLTAVLVDAWPPYIMRLSYTADNKWETIFKGGKKPTTESRPWEPKKEYQVALMLQGNKASVYIDGKSLGEEEALSTDERPPDVLRFCFGTCDIDDGDEEEDEDEVEESSPEEASPEKPSTKEIGKEPRLTVTNVFLYNRPLNSTEMTAIKERIPVLARGPELQADDVPQTIASAGSAVPGPLEVPAAPAGRTANTQHAPAGRFTSAGNEGTARETGDGGANGDAGSAYGRGLLPLLLLLGLWGFATA